MAESEQITYHVTTSQTWFLNRSQIFVSDTRSAHFESEKKPLSQLFLTSEKSLAVPQTKIWASHAGDDHHLHQQDGEPAPTSDIKMIDIWLILRQIYPFVDVVWSLQTHKLWVTTLILDWKFNPSVKGFIHTTTPKVRKKNVPYGRKRLAASRSDLKMSLSLKRTSPFATQRANFIILQRAGCCPSLWWVASSIVLDSLQHSSLSLNSKLAR